MAVASEHDHDVTHDHPRVPVSRRGPPSLHLTVEEVSLLAGQQDVRLGLLRRFDELRLLLSLLLHRLVVGLKVGGGVADQK